MKNGQSIQIVISTDGHVMESEEMWDRLPKRFQQMRPRIEPQPEGGFIVDFHGFRVRFEKYADTATDEDFEREFRRDPAGGRDLERRLAHLERDGIHAEVVFPNFL